MCLHSVIMESKRKLEVPDSSLGGFWHGGCLKDTPRKLHITFQISACLGSAPSPMCHLSLLMESKRTLEVHDRSLGGFWHGGCLKDISRKLRINFQISTCLGSAPSPMCLQSVIMESKRTLEAPERSLGGFLHNGCPKKTSRNLHINFQISTFLESGRIAVKKHLDDLINYLLNQPCDM